MSLYQDGAAIQPAHGSAVSLWSGAAQNLRGLGPGKEPVPRDANAGRQSTVPTDSQWQPAAALSSSRVHRTGRRPRATAYNRGTVRRTDGHDPFPGADTERRCVACDHARGSVVGRVVGRSPGRYGARRRLPAPPRAGLHSDRPPSLPFGPRFRRGDTPGAADSRVFGVRPAR